MSTETDPYVLARQKMAAMTPDERLEWTLRNIRSYALERNLTAEQVSDIFHAGIGAASWLRPELVGSTKDSG